MKVDIHADDYGYSINTSKDIIECVKKGNLNSFSILCNMSCFDECMDLLYQEIPSFKYMPLLSIHINLPEGIMDSNYLPLSWVNLFLGSIFRKSILKKEIKKVIKDQIDKTQVVIDKCINIAKENGIEVKQKGIRLDSHVHTHLIPVVWESLVEVIDENNYDVEFIRNPKEPIIPFMKRNIFSYGLANIIKNRILMFYSKKVDKYCDSHNLNKMYMWGLLMSGHMDYDRIKDVYPNVIDYCKNKNRDLEILFHPGLALKDEYSDEKNLDYYNDFNSSKFRTIEKNSVLRIEEIV